MFAKVLFRRLALVTASICIAQAGFIAAARAQSLPSDTVSLSLLPLEPRSAEVGARPTALATVADNVNTQVANDRELQRLIATEGVLQFEDIPVVGDLFTPSGEVNMDLDLPVSVSVGSVLGSYGVVVRKDMDMSLLGSSPDTTAPIDR